MPWTLIVYFKIVFGEHQYFLVALSQERSDLTGHCAVHWLTVCVWTVAKNSNFQNFIEFQKFQTKFVFQAILSNFDFWTSPPPPPPQVLCRFVLIQIQTPPKLPILKSPPPPTSYSLSPCCFILLSLFISQSIYLLSIYPK